MAFCQFFEIQAKTHSMPLVLVTALGKTVLFVLHISCQEQLNVLLSKIQT